MHVPRMAYLSRDPRPKFTKFGEHVSIGQAPNLAQFRRASTKTVRDIRCRKFMLPEKWTAVHQNRR